MQFTERVVECQLNTAAHVHASRGGFLPTIDAITAVSMLELRRPSPAASQLRIAPNSKIATLCVEYSVWTGHQRIGLHHTHIPIYRKALLLSISRSPSITDCVYTVPCRRQKVDQSASQVQYYERIPLPNCGTGGQLMPLFMRCLSA